MRFELTLLSDKMKSCGPTSNSTHFKEILFNKNYTRSIKKVKKGIRKYIYKF